jgi:hypothetical protein
VLHDFSGAITMHGVAQQREKTDRSMPGVRDAFQTEGAEVK